MSIVKMTVKEIMDLGLWDKVCKYKGWNPWILAEGQIRENEIVEFDSEFKKEEVSFKTKFTSECYIIQDTKGNFVYGECEGAGKDFEQAQKFNDSEDAIRFVNHHEEYDSDHWKIFRVKINYEIIV